MNEPKQASNIMKWMAGLCVICPVCRAARRDGDSIFAWSVKTIESRICPFCIAYEKVYGVKAHLPPDGR